MSKRLAIEWDSREIRVVAGTARGNTVRITDVVSKELTSTEPDALSETLRSLLSDAGLERLQASVALGRGKAELRQLKLPPVPPEELPEMVRFEAMRSFAHASERSAIDFLPTGSDDETINVLAAAVGPEELKSTAMIAVPSQLAVEHLVLRPLAAASLYKNSGQPTEGEVVLVDLLADDADIVVLRDGVPIFVRSIRLADDATTRVRMLSGEIRRSLMACEAGDRKGESPRIVMWGKADVHAEEVAGLSSALSSEVTTLDPFTLVEVESKLKKALPDHVGRLAPLIGMLHADASSQTDLIDFLNPRKPPEAPSNRNRYAIYGVMAAAAVGLVCYLGWNKFHKLDLQIASLEAQVASYEENSESIESTIADTEEIDRFLDGNVIWLEELKRATLKLPPSDQAILQAIDGSGAVGRIGPSQSGGGTLTLAGFVTDPSILAAMEDDLRDEDHTVTGSGTGEANRPQSEYMWTFSESISVTGPYVRERRDRLRAEAAANSDGESEADTAPADNAAVEETAPSTDGDGETSDDAAELPATEDEASSSPSDMPAETSEASDPAAAEESTNSQPGSEETSSAEPAGEDTSEREDSPPDSGGPPPPADDVSNESANATTESGDGGAQ